MSLYKLLGHGHTSIKRQLSINKYNENNIEKFTVPKNISIIYFCELGKTLEPPITFDNYLIDNINNYDKANEEFNLSNKYNLSKNDIEYIRYDENMLCPELNINVSNNTIINEKTNKIKYEQKIGLIKYPLNKNDYFINKNIKCFTQKINTQSTINNLNQTNIFNKLSYICNTIDNNNKIIIMVFCCRD